MEDVRGLAEIEALQLDKWQKCNEDEKKAALEKAEEILAEAQGREARPIEYPIDMPEYVRGGIDRDNPDTIYLNENLLGDTPYQAFQTVAHEGYHVYQYECIHDPVTHSEVESSKIEAWQENWGDYVNPEPDFIKEYFSQPIEADTRQYAAEITQQLYPEITVTFSPTWDTVIYEGRTIEQAPQQQAEPEPEQKGSQGTPLATLAEAAGEIPLFPTAILDAAAEGKVNPLPLEEAEKQETPTPAIAASESAKTQSEEVPQQPEQLPNPTPADTEKTAEASSEQPPPAMSMSDLYKAMQQEKEQSQAQEAAAEKPDAPASKAEALAESQAPAKMSDIYQAIQQQAAQEQALAATAATRSMTD